MNNSTSVILLICFALLVAIITFMTVVSLICTTIKDWRKFDCKKRFLKIYLAFLLFAITWLSGGIFFIEDFLLGGTSLSGKIENNEFYLGRGHGSYAKVSERCYKTVETLDRAFIIYFVLCLISIPIVQYSVKNANKIMFEEDES